MKTKPRRRCRMCGKPEKMYAFGYSDFTPYSQICVKCVNKVLELLEKEKRMESCPKCGGRVTRENAYVDEGEGAEAGRTFYYCSERCRETH